MYEILFMCWHNNSLMKNSSCIYIWLKGYPHSTNPKRLIQMWKAPFVVLPSLSIQLIASLQF